jgi:hypothetical protein
MRHLAFTFSRFSRIPVLATPRRRLPAVLPGFSLMLYLLCLPFVLAATADDAAGDSLMVMGGYTFQRNQVADSPNAFVSRNPGEDTILFQNNAVLDADVFFEFSDFERWEQWHKETGADPDRVDEYGLNPLSAITIGNAYKQITMNPGSRIINRAFESDGIVAFGAADITIAQDAVVHGQWSGISLGNFKDPEEKDFYAVSIVNQGRIGSFPDDSGAKDADGNFPVIYSRSGIQVYEGVGGSLFNESTGVIQGTSFGIRTNYSERQGEYIPMPGETHEISYFEGRGLNIENHGEIRGGSFEGIFDGGGLENVSIVNYESGLIKGGRSGIVLLRGGDIDNQGTIEGGETGIFISSGTANISHSGVLSVTGERGGDAIHFGENTVGGTVTLYSAVEGNIVHTGDSSEAVISLMDNADESGDGSGDESDEASAAISVGNINFGDGRVTQQGGTWSCKNITAAGLRLEGGEMQSGHTVTVDQDINIAPDATMTITGGKITAENFVNRGLLNFQNGALYVDGGVFSYTDQAGGLDFNLAGSEDDQNPHLRLGNGAVASGIRALSVGGTHAGTLILEDARLPVLSGEVTVKDKGLLGGVGSVAGNVTARSGGALSPGYGDDPTGALLIDGNLVIEKGATIDVGVMQGDNNNAVIDVSREVSIAGGTVNVIDFSGRRLEDGATYTFLTSGLSMAGEFDAITGSPIYAFNLDYGFNNVSFNVIRLRDYSDYAETQNQAAMALAYKDARDGGDLKKLVPKMEDLLSGVLQEKGPADVLRSALDQLSPEPIQASFRVVADHADQMTRQLMSGARKTRQKLVSGDLGVPGGLEDGRARIVPGEYGTSTWRAPFRLFYGGFYGFADVDPDAGRSGYKHKGRGFYLGYERPMGDRVNGGASIGYARNRSSRFEGSIGKLEIESFRLGPHATATLGNLEIDVAFSGGLHLNRQEREMIIPLFDEKAALGGIQTVAFQEKAVSRYKIYDGSAFTDLRYNMDLGYLFRLTPTASMQYTHMRRKNLTEKHGGDINLKVHRDSYDVLRSMLGASLSREVRGSTFVLVPELFAGWRNHMLDRDVDLDAEFVNAADLSDRVFTVTGQGPDRQAYVVNVTITALFGDFNVAHIGWQREFADSGKVESFSAGVKWNF